MQEEFENLYLSLPENSEIVGAFFKNYENISNDMLQISMKKIIVTFSNISKENHYNLMNDKYFIIITEEEE